MESQFRAILAQSDTIEPDVVEDAVAFLTDKIQLSYRNGLKGKRKKSSEDQKLDSSSIA